MMMVRIMKKNWKKLGSGYHKRKVNYQNMSKFEIKNKNYQKIKDFIEEKDYQFKVEDLIESYEKYWLTDEGTSFIKNYCIDCLEAELKILLDTFNSWKVKEIYNTEQIIKEKKELILKWNEEYEDIRKERELTFEDFGTLNKKYGNVKGLQYDVSDEEKWLKRLKDETYTKQERFIMMYRAFNIKED
jgi:hypothetical protein